MRGPRSLSALALAFLASCLDAPRFTEGGSAAGGGGASDPAATDPSTDPASPGATTPIDPGDDDMVRVGPTTLPEQASAPTAKDDNAGKGKGAKPVTDAGAAPPSRSVPAFWIDAREVRVAAYEACVARGACEAARDLGACSTGLAAHPVDCVTLDDARAYCAWRGKRLVTHDEFTAAAAGSVGRPYPWGSAAPSAERLDACGAECGAAGMYPTFDGYARTAPCGSFPGGKTPEGAFDLAGNVAEWVDAAGASIVRGGSYADVDPASVSSRAMRTVPAGTASPGIGFRCARD